MPKFTCVIFRPTWCCMMPQSKKWLQDSFVGLICVTGIGAGYILTDGLSLIIEAMANK